jgi:hypothetical protein
MAQGGGEIIMNFTDDNLKRLREQLKDPAMDQEGHDLWEALLARMEAAETVVRSVDRLMFTKEITDKLIHLQFLDWRKACGKS